MILQTAYHIAEICSQQGVTHAVVCPGSRCAPLTLAFARHPKIKTRTFTDERSAAFIALGMAQQSRTPVVLICTSGSAAYNFAPAIAEAFFSHIPLIVLTADRPPEWIDQLDGQTIRQTNLYGRHIKKSFQFPVDYENDASQWHLNRQVNEAAILAQAFPAGPVHCNIPFREPFYPIGEKVEFKKDIRIIRATPTPSRFTKNQLEELSLKLSTGTKILVVAGQLPMDDQLHRSLEKFARNRYATIVGDVISNLHGLEQTIRHAEAFLGQCNKDVKQSLQPDLLITIGESILSKNLKLFLRTHPAKEHWHIQPGETAADTYQQLSKLIWMEPEYFFKELSEPSITGAFEVQKKENYQKLWLAEENRAKRAMDHFFSAPSFDELRFVQKFIQSLPSRCNLHLANSMSVRYANLIGLTAQQRGIHVYANRGTSGIDGSTSTAVGHSLTSDVPNFLLTGDLAFFYDRNAFWHNYPCPNLQVLVLNNHGGIIFNMIDGPSQQPELEEYFITDQRLRAESLAHEFQFDYQLLDAPSKEKNVLKDFISSEGKTKILEVVCSAQTTKEQYENLKQQIRKSYDT